MKIFLCEYIHPDARAMLAARAELIDDWARIGEADGILNRNLNIDAAVLERCTAQEAKVIADVVRATKLSMDKHF